MTEHDWAWVASRGDPELILTAADMAEEAGQDGPAHALRRGDLLPELLWAGDGTGSGYGNGMGPETGEGTGYGAGYEDGTGTGDGAGYAYGDGYGDGDGGGTGYGTGYGEGWLGDGFPTALETLAMDDLTTGQAYLWMVGHGWMFIGRFVRREGLFGAMLSDVVNVCRTGPTPWDELCAGTGRQEATFRRWPNATPRGTPFPYAVPLARWEGELPETQGRWE